jgi:1-pyrroline-5-carboxylate dehydrogenase
MDAVTSTPDRSMSRSARFPRAARSGRLQAKLAELAANPTEIHHVINGEHRRGTA